MANSSGFELFTSLRYDPLLVNIRTNTSLSHEGTSNPVPSHGTPFYILPYHRDRILQAAEHFGWELAAARLRGPRGLAFLTQHLEAALQDQSSGALRAKVLVSQDGSVRVETGPVPSVPEFNLFPARLPPPKNAEPLKVSPLTGGTLTLGDTESIHGDPLTVNFWDVLLDTQRTEPSSYTSYKTTSRNMYDSARKNVGIKEFTEPREVLLVSTKNGEIMEGSLTTIYFWREGKWVTPKMQDGGQIGTTRRWALSKGICFEATVTVDQLKDGEECWISNGVRGFQVGRIKIQH